MLGKNFQLNYPRNKEAGNKNSTLGQYVVFKMIFNSLGFKAKCEMVILD